MLYYFTRHVYYELHSWILSVRTPDTPSPLRSHFVTREFLPLTSGTPSDSIEIQFTCVLQDLFLTGTLVVYLSSETPDPVRTSLPWSSTVTRLTHLPHLRVSPLFSTGSDSLRPTPVPLLSVQSARHFIIVLFPFSLLYRSQPNHRRSLT